jgi:Protein of unknown function (DUF2934)
MPRDQQRRGIARAATDEIGLTTPESIEEAPDSSADEVQQQIRETAYYRAESRGFEPGKELDDWLEAEAEVRRRLRR